MMRVSALIPVLAIAALAACGHRAAVEEPAPEPAPAPAPAPAPTPAPAPAPAPPRDDSERIRREQEAKAAAERARADLTAAIHFDYDKADIRAEDQAILDHKAALLKANPNVHLRIGGNTDDRGSDEYNLALGNRRAAAAKRYLENKGVDGSRLEAVSYGEERPLVQGNDESAWSQNRRDEFEVTAGGDNLVPAP